MPIRMHDHEADIDDLLVRCLLRDQMPDLAELELTIVEPWGTNNAVWRVGDELGVDDATIRRSRGVAVNQACAALPYDLEAYPRIVERSWHKLAVLGIGPLRS